jgi:hypothetical protein
MHFHISATSTPRSASELDLFEHLSIEEELVDHTEKGTVRGRGQLDQRKSQLHHFTIGFQKPGICTHWIPETRNLRRFLVSGIQW